MLTLNDNLNENKDDHFDNFSLNQQNDFFQMPQINFNDFFKSFAVEKKTKDDIRFESIAFLKDHEIINTDTVIGNTYFVYFDSTNKELNVILRDGKIGDIKCMALISNDCFDVNITDERKNKFKIAKKHPFLNLYYLPKGWSEKKDNFQNINDVD
jgi:hypothetical protein